MGIFLITPKNASARLLVRVKKGVHPRVQQNINFQMRNFDTFVNLNYLKDRDENAIAGFVVTGLFVPFFRSHAEISTRFGLWMTFCLLGKMPCP